MNRIAHILALSFGIAASTAAFPREALAQDANGFGEKGGLIVSADRLMPLFSYASATVTTKNNGREDSENDSASSIALLFGRDSTVALNPHAVPRISADFVVIPRLTVGGSFALAFGLGGSHTSERGNTTVKVDTRGGTLIGLAPRVGYVIPLGQTFAVWPRGGLAFYSLSTKSDITGNNNNIGTQTNTDSLWSLDLDPQFVWAPIPHFFASGGPLLNIPFAGSRTNENVQGNTTTTTKSDLSVFHFGLSIGLGGWFDL